VDGGVTLVVAGEQLLVAGLGAVVELLGDAFPQLREQRVDVLARCADLEHPPQQGDVTQVSLDGLGDARVLDLDRDRAAVKCDRAVHLPDRRGRDRFGVPGREDLLRWPAQLFRDDAGGQLGAHRRHAVLQPAQRPAGGRRQPVVDVAGHLAQLHQHALHRPQGGGDVLGRLQGQVIAQLLPVLARGGEQLRRVPRVARASPPDQPQGRQPPCDPQVGRPPPAGLPAQERHRRDRRAARRHGDSQLPGPRLHPALLLTAERVRRTSRCRASRTPGSARNTASSTPSAWRISVRRPAVSGAGAG
jgi:hypothetical protein